MNINIYGDNIIECERAFKILKLGINIDNNIINEELNLNNLICPLYTLTDLKNVKYYIRLFPGTQKKRWNINIYERFIRDNGGILEEGADAIITIVSKNSEFPIIAFEFSNALPAGNNAWQRSGRALSFSQADIPYIYITEVGGNELDKDGKIKGTRYPNSTVILSYILNTIRTNTTNLLDINLSSVANDKVHGLFKELSSNDIASNLTFNLIHQNDSKENIQELL